VFPCLVFRCDTLRARAREFRNENQHDLEFPRTSTDGSGIGQRIPSQRFSRSTACRWVVDVWFVLSLATLRGCSFANIRGAAAGGERNPAKMKWSPTQRPTILKVSTSCWQLLLARHRRLLLEPSGDKPTLAFRPRGRLRASQGGLRALGRHGVGAGESGWRGCWVSVSNPAS